MRLEKVIIPDAKLGYLLNWREKDDKSGLVKRLGFTAEEPERLRQAILMLVANNDAVSDGANKFGNFYRVTGDLLGPSGAKSLTTVWMQRYGEGVYRFVTLRPE
ncbi:MAG: DUF6883 domain-containing protein [Cyanobacteria bacterium P01_C01_bin.70]